jgi:hypothetical protein
VTPLCPQKLVLTSPTSCAQLVGMVHLQTKRHGVFFSSCVCVLYPASIRLQTFIALNALPRQLSHVAELQAPVMPPSSSPCHKPFPLTIFVLWNTQAATFCFEQSVERRTGALITHVSAARGVQTAGIAHNYAIAMDTHHQLPACKVQSVNIIEVGRIKG